MPNLKDFLGPRLKSLNALLNKSWTILPRRNQTFPEQNSWWAIAVIWIVLGGLTLGALYYDPYSPHNALAIKPLTRMEPLPTSPQFTEGAAVRVRMPGTVYAGTETDRPLQEPLPDAKSGVVLDGIWKQGRWLYQVRFSPTQVGWVGEPDLIPLHQGP